MDRIVPCENTVERRGRHPKPLTSRLHKSKNFWKLDRNLDAFINASKVLRANDKNALRTLLNLRKQDDSNEVKTTISGLIKLMGINIKTVRASLDRLCDKGFLHHEQDVWEKGCNYPKRSVLR